ncbi:MAG: PEP-CTERM sorting domain-containing protein [Akkermansia sp.]|nr:PEP-CTERM sorting domain-containing protein [Akkermansia sp.]
MHNGIEINRWRNVLSLIDNKDVTFSNNSASGKGHTSGGAIAAWHDDRILIKNNSGAVTFSGNYAYNEGGAIFAKAAVKADGKMYGPEITISGNHSVKFTGNYVGREEDGKTNVYGGAVYAASGMTLANNGTVEFSGNYLTTSNRYTGYGAAIYIGAELSDASLVIAGNDRVVFGNNYVKEYSNSISGDCHMGSIYGENGDAENVFSTSSSSTSTIEFRDAVYLMGDLDINSSYLDIDNVKQDATGKVVFAGQYVQGYLQNQMSFDSRYAAKTDISRTSTLGGDVTVHGGSLQIVEDAIVNIGGMLDIGGKLSVDGQQVNTARVDVASGKLNVGATTDASGTGLIRLETNGSLNLTGDAVVTAGQVTLDGATLDMSGTAKLTATAGDLTASNAAGITMTGGALSIGSKELTLDTGAEMNLSGSAAVTAGQVTLTDATLKMQGGTLTATGGDLVVTKSSALVDEGAAEKTYDVAISGGTLDIGDQTLDLGSGTSMELSGGQVTAGQVKLENAALDMAGDAELTASEQVTLDGANLTMEGGTLDASAQGMAVQAAGIKMTGGTLNNGEHALELGSGTSMELSGSAAVTAGQVTLTDATLKMQGGTLTAKSGDLVVAKTSPEVALADEGAAEKTYDVSVTGGTLDIGGQTLELGSGTSMELSGGQVTAGQVKLDAATLEMAGTAKLTATSGDLSVLNAGGISMTGGTLDIGSNKLELGTGAEMDVSGGQVSADQVALTGAKLTIGGEAQVDALGGIEAQKAELVMQGGSLNAGTLELVDATLQMDAGVLDASTGGVRLSDSASLVLNGGSLNVGENDIELGADMKLSLGESALVSAGKITVRESATFSVSAASSGKKQAPLAQTLTPVDNMDPTLKGAMLSADLELMGGSTYDATGGSVSLGGHELTLSTSDASKINLVLTLDSLSDPDAQIIIFSDVAMVNFLFNHEGAPVVAGEDGNVSVSASNYFDNDWKDDYYINFDKAAGLVYLSSGLPSDPSEPGATPGTPAVPEPSSTALGLMALAGLAMRRRRK